jgi:hypothetical protein
MGSMTATLEAAAERLAALLTGTTTTLQDPEGHSDLEFLNDVEVRPLGRAAAPADVWAVDGGQCLVADARCVQLYATRAARIRYRDGACVLEEEGELHAAVIGKGDPSDVNLLRDRDEWAAVAQCVDDADPGALVLVDGDLQPDWRVPSTFLAELLTRAAERGIVLAGITKHSSLSRGGAPLLGWLERDAETLLGPRAMWWASVARTRTDVGGFQVVAAQLDPDARFSFRIDLPLDVDPEPALASLSALSDDAAFPGYPYPLAVADGLAACSGWLRADLRSQLDDLFDRAGVPFEVRERAFADRHNLMERA